MHQIKSLSHSLELPEDIKIIIHSCRSLYPTPPAKILTIAAIVKRCNLFAVFFFHVNFVRAATGESKAP